MNGANRRTQIKRPAGFGLDENAVQAVKDWSFAPATREGKPIKVLVNIKVAFRLQ